MKERQRKCRHKKRYSKISTQKRLKLVKMVIEDGLALTKVAKLLHIKRPTAKVILKRFKENGTFFQKRMNQLKTKDSIQSNHEIKVEQRSEESISLELQPQQSSRAIKSEEVNQGSVEQQKVQGPVSFLIYYPPFDCYQGFA